MSLLHRQRKERIVNWVAVVLLAALVVGCNKPAVAPSPGASENSTANDLDTNYSAVLKSTDLEGMQHLKTANGTYDVMYRARPYPIPLNEPFAIDVLVFDQRGAIFTDAKLTVDARMPHHRHGMVVEPKVTSNENGWAVEGMQFHMPGRWELYFDLTRAGFTERAQDVIVLE